MIQVTYGGYKMPTVQLKINGQMTLPVKIRRALGLDQGSFLDVQLREGQIVLTPQALVKKAEIRKKAYEATERIRERNKDIPLKEIERDVTEAVKTVRS